MVVLFVAPFFEEKGQKPRGGVNMYLRRITGALKELGHTPLLLSFGTRNMHYMENGVEIFFVHCPYIKLSMPKIEMVYNSFLRNVTINKKINELIETKNVDIIQFASIWGMASCYYGKTPAVMRLSTYTKVYRDYRQDKAEVDFQAFLERLAARRCNAVFAPSNIIADTFSKAIHRNVSVIESPFWNDCVTYDDSVYVEKLRGKKYFLFFGRLVADKGIYIIAQCLKDFLQYHSEYYFVCCGIRPNFNNEDPVAALRDAAGQYKDRFIYIKPLSHDALYPVINHAQFVVFPSLIDNFSNACIEAMYFGRVVIGTVGTSYEQLIEDEKSGFLCQPNNAIDLLEKMNKAATLSDGERDSIGRAAKKRIAKLTPQHVVKKLLRYYQHVIDHIAK